MRVKRVVATTILYALAAALVLAAPLAASEEPVAVEAVVEAPEPEAPPAKPAETLSAEPTPEPKPAAAAAKASPQTQPVLAKAAPGTVTISDFEFAPASITVNVGETVTWSNAGPTPHSATGDSFDTEVFEEGESRSHTFNEAGEFAYICTPHPDMKGTVIVVKAAASQDEGTSDTDTDTGSAADGPTATDPGTGSTAASTPTLPATGLDAGSLLALGLITLAVGAFLRRRSAGTG